MSQPSTIRMAEAVQRAAGAIAARHRGDADGAEALLAAFADPTEEARAFCLLAELALGLVCAQTAQSMDELVQDLTLLLGHAIAASPPS